LTVLDTTVIIALLKGKTETLAQINKLIEKEDTLGITTITAYELLKGAYLSTKQKENTQAVKEVISNLQIFDLSPQACEEAAQIYNELENVGKKISEFDILIAAIAKTNNEAILTYDKHFKAIKGLHLI
jgi:tRNA(fMet)-specific endonuclease VapC